MYLHKILEKKIPKVKIPQGNKKIFLKKHLLIHLYFFSIIKQKNYKYFYQTLMISNGCTYYIKRNYKS